MNQPSPESERLAIWLSHYATCIVDDERCGRKMLEIVDYLRSGHAQPAPASPVSARQVFAYQLARRGYDPKLDMTKDALDAFDEAIGLAQTPKVSPCVLCGEPGHTTLVCPTGTVPISSTVDHAQTPALSRDERHAIAHARYQVGQASMVKPDCCFDYDLVKDLLRVIDRAYADSSTDREDK